MVPKLEAMLVVSILVVAPEGVTARIISQGKTARLPAAVAAPGFFVKQTITYFLAGSTKARLTTASSCTQVAGTVTATGTLLVAWQLQIGGGTYIERRVLCVKAPTVRWRSPLRVPRRSPLLVLPSPIQVSVSAVFSLRATPAMGRLRSAAWGTATALPV